MALAKNQNKDTLVGLKAAATRTNERWVRRGAGKTGGNSGVADRSGFCTIRAAARRGVAVHPRVNPCGGK
jgi:hypothetical protein